MQLPITVSGSGAGGGPAPNLSTATINNVGYTLTLVFDQNVTVSDNTGFTLSTGRGLTYYSGSGSNTLVYHITPKALTGTTTVSYATTGGITYNGAALASITNHAITNNSGVVVADNFDGGSTSCVDDANTNCWFGWNSVSQSTVNNQATGLETGSDHGKSNNANSGYANGGWGNIASTNTAYMFAEMKGTVGDISSGNKATTIFLYDSGFTVFCALQVLSSSFIVATESGFTTMSLTPGNGTKYWVWLEDTGGTCTAKISTTSSKAGATSVSQSGSSTPGFTYFGVQALNLANMVYNPITYDKIELGTAAAFGDDGN